MYKYNVLMIVNKYRIKYNNKIFILEKLSVYFCVTKTSIFLQQQSKKKIGRISFQVEITAIVLENILQSIRLMLILFTSAQAVWLFVLSPPPLCHGPSWTIENLRTYPPQQFSRHETITTCCQNEAPGSSPDENFFRMFRFSCF